MDSMYLLTTTEDRHMDILCVCMCVNKYSILPLSFFPLTATFLGFCVHYLPPFLSDLQSSIQGLLRANADQTTIYTAVCVLPEMRL